MKQFPAFIICVWLLILVLLGCKVSDSQSNAVNGNSSSLTNSSSESTAITEPTNSVAVLPLDTGLVLNMKVEHDGTRKARVVGETNLPSGTELMVSIEGKSLRYTGQDKTTVQDGLFQSDTFTSNHNDLEPGQYVAEVVMPVPSVQPASVRAVIGEKGENLKGSLVKRKDDSFFGLTVRVEQPFQLKSDGTIVPGTNQAEIATAKKRVVEVLKALKQLERQGRTMEALRSTDNLDRLRQCGELMREGQRRAEDLRAKAEALPQPFGTYLTLGATEIKLCVSCASSAMNYCNKVKESLVQAEKEMGNENSLRRSPAP